MSGVKGVPPTGESADARPITGSGPSRVVGRVPPPRSVPGVAGLTPKDDQGQPIAAFDPITAVLELSLGAASPPAAGLQAQLLDWVAPRTRQFEAMQPSRLLPLLGMAVDRLAAEAHDLDDLGRLGAASLERELRDHQALADRRATMIDP